MLNPRYLKGDTWGFPGAAVEHIETHAAHVFLCGDRAFKIKKQVKFPYLYFSTLALRRAILQRELEIRSRWARSFPVRSHNYNLSKAAGSKPEIMKLPTAFHAIDLSSTTLNPKCVIKIAVEKS
jgi:hypothetical protein